MRARDTTICTVLIIAVTLVAPIFSPAQADGFRAVADPHDRFTISVPLTWQVRTSDGDPSVEATSPAPTGALPDTLDVIARDFSTTLSAEECVQKAEWLMRLVSVDFKTVEKHPGSLAGLNAFAHAYTWRTRSGADRRSYQVCVTVKRRVFILIGSTTNDPTYVLEHLPVLQRMIETFRPKAVSTGRAGTPTTTTESGDR